MEEEMKNEMPNMEEEPVVITAKELSQNKKQLRKPVAQANILWFITVISVLIGSVVIAFVIKDGTYAILIAQASMLIPSVVYLLVTKRNPIETLRIRPFHFGSMFLVLLFTICMMPLISLVNATSMLFFSNMISDTMVDITQYGLGVALLLIALTPAVVEEVTFRGVLMGSYCETKRPLKAIFFSALAFGLMHMNFNQFSYAFVLGLLMGVILELTESIFATSLIHFCINGFSTTLTWAMPKLTEFYAKNATPEQAAAFEQSMSASSSYTPEQLKQTIMTILPVAFVGVIIGAFLLLAIATLNNTRDKITFWFSKEMQAERAKIAKVRFMDAPFVICMVLCLLMCILTEISARVAG